MWSILSNEDSNLFDNTDSDLSNNKIKWISYKFAKHLSNYNSFNVDSLDLYNQLLDEPDCICELAFILATLKINYGNNTSNTTRYTDTINELHYRVESDDIFKLIELGNKVI